MTQFAVPLYQENKPLWREGVDAGRRHRCSRHRARAVKPPADNFAAFV
jgi:hypothetical protein